MAPVKAGACVPVPSASSRPSTPTGSLGVDSPMRTPLVVSRFLFAAASTFSGLTPGLSSPPHAPSTESARARMRLPRALRARPLLMRHSLPRDARLRAGNEGVDRPGDGGYRLGSRNPGAVPPAVGLGQVHGRAAGCGRPRRPAARPGQDQRVLPLEEAVGAHPAGAAALRGVLLEPGHLDRARLRTGQRAAGSRT